MVWLGILPTGGIAMHTEGSMEQALRRTLKAAGYTIRRSRDSINPDNLGGYMLVDLSSHAVVAGSRYELSMAEVRDWAKDLR